MEGTASTTHEFVPAQAPVGSKLTVIAESYGPWEAGHFAKGDGW